MKAFLKSIAAGLERTREVSEDLNRRAQAYNIKTKAKLDYAWFNNFRLFVGSALELAKSELDLDEELNSDPEVKKIFLELAPDYESKSTSHEVQVPEWARKGPPLRPIDSAIEPEHALLHKEAFEEAKEEHAEFLRHIRKEIENRPKLRKPFRAHLTSTGLRHIYDEYFLASTSPAALQPGAAIAGHKALTPIIRNPGKSRNFLPTGTLQNFEPETPKHDKESNGPAETTALEEPVPLSSTPSRVIEPPRNELHRLPTPLEAGERIVLEFFDRNLDPAWEIYVQPHLNGLCPDFVLLNPTVGIAVFEVKNWDFRSIDYFPKKVGSRRLDLWGALGGKEFSKEAENPFRKIALYKDRIFNIYCPRLQQQAGFAAITGGVIFPSAHRAQVLKLQRGFIRDSEQKTASTYLPVCGGEELEANDLSKVFPEALRGKSRVMTPALANDLRGWLVEPDFSKEQRQPLPLDNQQRRLAETRTSSGLRRIKGPAGSGKSLVLAARAARLASEGKSVLVVSFNITLWHYLRDMIRRDISHRDAMKNVELTHFHEWCKDLCEFTGFGLEYSELFTEVHQLEASKLPEKEKRNQISCLLGSILDNDVPSLANRAALSDKAPRYDAILVDEAQDYLPLWWLALKSCRKPGGEMLLVADTTQDIYNKAESWTDEAMSGAGFSGDWARLDGSYRLPREALNAAQKFAREFLPEDKVDLAEPHQGNLDVEPCTLRWIQCAPEESRKHCVDAILAMMRETGPHSGAANADITFICNEIGFGKSVADELDTYSGVRTIHTFEENRMEQVRKKMAFWMGDARVKATTLHSFKGWECRLLVVHVGHAVGNDSLASIYAALTRLKRSPLGSWLTVVCSAPELANFGKTWVKNQ